MRYYDPDLYKYWVTQSDYFILATTVALGMGITDGKLLLCHGTSQESDDKNISTKEYINRTVYDYSNNPFTADLGSPALNLPQITIDDRPCLHKRERYTPDLIPVAISVTSENSVSTLTTPYDSERLFILTSDDPKPLNVILKYEIYRDRVIRYYCCRKHDEKICYKKTRFY